MQARSLACLIPPKYLCRHVEWFAATSRKGAIRGSLTEPKGFGKPSTLAR